MQIHVAIDRHFARAGGAYYSNLNYDYAYWQEYLDVVAEVCPVARVRDVSAVEDRWRRADGRGVCFVPVTSYSGFWQFVARSPRVLLDCRRAVADGDAFLLRWGLVSATCWVWLRLYRKPYAFECIGHAGEGVIDNRQIQVLGLNRAVSWIAHRLCQEMARGASCAAYVSRYAQDLYPSREREHEWIFTSVQLSTELVTAARPADSFRANDHHLVSVGRLEPEKGHAVLVRAVAELVRQGHQVRATLVGPGREQQPLAALARELGIADRIALPGQVKWGPELWSILDDGDLFVLPSLTEG
ncbi:MAG: glycosyltransferase, partial [Myxococcota bacterium]